MKIQFLGTGSAFCMENNQSNTIIEENGKMLLIDAGGDIRFSLKKAGLSYKSIDALYLTHLHADHVGGGEYLAFCTYFDPSVKDKITLIGNHELINEVWDKSWSGGLKSIQGKKTNINDFFDLMMIHKNGKFIWEDIEFHIVQSVHIMDEYSIVPSFGLIFKSKSGKKIYYTGDTQFNPNQIMDFYRDVDIIIQDCETTPFKSGVHANYSELVTLPDNIKQKMILHHYQDNVVLEFDKWTKKAKEDGFGELYGFVPQGHIIEV